MHEDLYELCLKVRKDPERCSFGVRVERLVDELGLEKCVQEDSAVNCFEMCVERCGGGEDCVRACHAAVDAAAARGLVRHILKGAVEMVLESNLTVAVPEAVAAFVSKLLKSYADADCAAKSMLFHVMSLTVAELHNLVGSDLLLLLAPLISTTYGCVEEEEVDKLLEEVKLAAGELEAAKISDALDNGEVVIKRVRIIFPPAKPRQ
jgi:hypothetical protein